MSGHQDREIRRGLVPCLVAKVWSDVEVCTGVGHKRDGFSSDRRQIFNGAGKGT